MLSQNKILFVHLQINSKTNRSPYVDLGDEWFARHRDQIGQRWYEMSALQMVIQAAGEDSQN
jgi:hypothetical protein